MFKPARQNRLHSFSVCPMSGSLRNPWNCVSHFISIHIFAIIYYNLFKWWDPFFGLFILISFGLFSCSETLIWTKCLSRIQINSIPYSLYMNYRIGYQSKIVENKNIVDSQLLKPLGEIEKRFELLRVQVIERKKFYIKNGLKGNENYF